MAKTKKMSSSGQASGSSSIQQKSTMKTRSQTEGSGSDDDNKSPARKYIKGRVSADTLALEKSEQRKVAKETKKIKKGIRDGSIIVKQNRKEAKERAAQRRGLVYIGHIPHGFYEKQMKNYFKQFGKVTNVQVCRSRVSGNCKGYGYVEFEHPEVAKIAAETMNNYVMFKKRIVAKYVPYEKRPKHLFQGKSSTPEHTSVKSRRGKQKHTRNKVLDDATVAKKTKAAFQRLQKKLNKLNQQGIVCNTKPVHLDENIISGSTTDNSVESLSFRKSSKSKRMTDIDSSSSSKKSLTGIKSNKLMLTKSLDSVKALLHEKSQLSKQDGETQTAVPKRKSGKAGKKLTGVTKIKNNKVANIDNNAVRKIARDLIRKRGNALVNVKPSKLVKAGKGNKK